MCAFGLAEPLVVLDESGGSSRLSACASAPCWAPTAAVRPRTVAGHVAGRQP